MRLPAILLVCAIISLPLMADFAVEKPCVILPASATATEAFASGELSRYLGEMLGKEIPVRKSCQEGEYPLRVGRACSAELTTGFSKHIASIEHDAFAIRQREDGTDLAGNSDRATLYAAYEFLEQLGCRWFFPGKLGECVPRLKSLVLQDKETRQIPSFNQRTIDVGVTDKMDFAEIIDWAAKNRLNFIPASRMAFVRRHLPASQQDIWEKRGGQQEWQFHVHNLTQMVPADKYFREHPEYFALYKGTRHPSGTPGKPGFGGGNLCTTNPDVINLCTRFVIDYFDRTPEGMVVPLWPADGSVIWCECPECKKLRGVNFMGGRRGSMTRRMLTFGNEVARRVAVKYPDRLILVPAYANYIQPMPDIPLEPNVFIQYCIHGDYAHGLDKSEENKAERLQLEAWATMTKGGPLGVWEYFLLGDHYSPPKENTAMLPCLYRVRYTLPFFHKIGVNNYMTQASTKYWKHNMAVYYFTARYAWNVQTDFNELLDDYTSNMFGPAGHFLRDYYLLVENAVEKADWHPVVYSDLAVPSPLVFTSEVLAKADELLAEARKCDLTPVQKQRLDLVLTTYNNIRNNVGVQSSLGLSASTPWSILREGNNYVMNPSGRELTEGEVERLVLNAKDEGRYDDEFRRILFRARKRSMPLLSLGNGQLTAVVLPELGGRLLSLASNHAGENIFFAPGEITASIGEKYVSYGGYEEFIGSGFASPGWECAYEVREQTHNSVTLSMDNDGLLIERTFTIQDKSLLIHSTLTNTTKESVTTLLRSHPFFTSPSSLDNLKVEIETEAGKRTSTIAVEHDRSTKNYNGGTCVIRGDRYEFIYQATSSANGDLYFCRMSDNVFTVEWLGHETMLAPNQKLELTQVFTIPTQENNP